MDFWMNLLKPYEARVVEAGVELVIREYEYKTLPPFAVLARAINKVTGTPDKPTAVKVSAEREWDNLMNQIERVGSYGDPQLHPTTDRVVRMMGGWRTVCQWRNDELQWRMKDFLDLWKNHAQNEPLMGLGTQEILDMINHKGKSQNALESNLARLEAGR